jgi:phytoene synthase
MSLNPSSPIPNPELDALIRRVDEDRWFASRFAPAPMRARLIPLYAVNYEIARTAETVRDPELGAVRLAWWREALEELDDGKPPRAHPALAALAPAPAVMAAFREIVDARARDFDVEPFSTWAELETYVDATAGAVMRAAMALTGAFSAGAKTFAKPAGRAWGFAGLARAASYWAARGRTRWPQRELIDGAEGAYVDASAFAPKQEASLFPAFGYVATLPGYLRALRQGKGETSPLGRRWALIVASATGRI